MEDDKIIALYWQRNEDALRETAAKYGSYCMKLSMNILNDPQESEENVSDAYLHTWNAIPPQRPQKLLAFLAKITRSLAINRYRAARAQKRGGDTVALSLEELDFCTPDRTKTEDTVDAAALSDCISRFLHRQGEDARRIFMRRYFHCETIEEIARRFGVSEAKVKSSLFRTREKLRKHLESEGFVYET